MSEEAYRLFSTAPRREGCPYVLPSPNDTTRHMTYGEHYGDWRRVLKAAGVPQVGTHGIRHRSATDIANSGVPIKVAMALTGHKTVAMFMRNVHTEDDAVRKAVERVANRRKTIVGGRPQQEQAAVSSVARSPPHRTRLPCRRHGSRGGVTFPARTTLRHGKVCPLRV